MSVVQVLVEEQQEAHMQRWNKGKIQQKFKIGDIVKVHVQVQSNADQGEVKKSHIKHEDHSKLRKPLGTIPTKSKDTTNQIKPFKNIKVANYVYFHQVCLHMILLTQRTNDTLTIIMLQSYPLSINQWTSNCIMKSI